VIAAAVALAIVVLRPGHGDRPVLHAVITSNIPDETTVNLSSGVERPIPQSLEYWYDAGRRLLRAISMRNGGVVFDARVPYDSARPLLDPALTAFVGGYREALKAGRARRVGSGTFAGHNVIWLRFDYRQFGERVGVDSRTERPVVIEPLDQQGKPTSPTWSVVSIGTGPYRARDFVGRRDVRQVSIASQFRMIVPDRASALVGWTPLWLGRSFRSLPLESTQLQAMVRNLPLPRRTAHGVLFSYGHLADRIQLMEGQEFERSFWPEPGPGPRPGTAWLRRGVVMGGGPIKRTCQALTRIGDVWVSVEGWNAASTRCIDAARALVRLPN
jgi:hypothetical protein